MSYEDCRSHTGLFYLLEVFGEEEDLYDPTLLMLNTLWKYMDMYVTDYTCRNDSEQATDLHAMPHLFH